MFYLWQVPHFWLLAEKHRADYARAGFKLTADRLPQGSQHRIMGLWVTTYFLGLAAFFLTTGHATLWGVMICLLSGTGATVATLAGRTRPAALLVDLSLPLALGAMLLIF